MRKSMRERQDEKREEALAEIREKVAGGTLTIRQMTVEERARYARNNAADRGTSRRAG
jgi:hypothetical protein